MEEVAKPVVATLTPSEIAERDKYREFLNRAYNVDWFRKEINMGLKDARVLLRGFATIWRDSHDLKQTVDIEIWKAILRYRGGMNGAIAYTIAKNQAGKFLGRQIKEPTVPVTTPVLD